MNYAAKQILHVYRQVKSKQAEAVRSVSKAVVRQSYGNFTFQVSDIFTSSGPDNLKYRNVGYGSVVFLGNIDGKVPTQGLFYKSHELKSEIEQLIIGMEAISNNKDEAVKYIQEQHGKPSTQHAILWSIA